MIFIRHSELGIRKVLELVVVKFDLIRLLLNLNGQFAAAIDIVLR